MRSSTISNVALLVTSLLVNDAFAAPMKREVVYAQVDVTQVVTVIALPGGGFSTELGPLSTNLPPAAASTPAAAPAPSSSSSSADAPAVKADAFTAPNADPAPSPASSTASSPASSPSPTSSAAPAPTSTSSSAPAATSSSSTAPGTTLSSKRGLAYNDASLLTQFTGGDSKASWAYNWGQTAGSIPEDLKFVPMLHDLGQVGTWAGVAKGAKYLLAFNEPDQPVSAGGSAISPSDAAAAYTANMMPYHGTAQIGAPAVSNGLNGGPFGIEGTNWLAPFFAACSGCKFDFIPFHWYGDNLDGLKNQVEAIITATQNIDGVYKDPATGKPVLWLTEFGVNDGQGNPGNIQSFLTQALPYLDGESAIARYAYQFVSDGFLVSGTSINAAGTAYISS